MIRTRQKKEALPLRLVRSIVGWVTLSATIAGLIYAMLAATVMVVMQVGGHNVLVLRNAFPIGQAPSGTYAYVSSSPIDNTFTGHLKEATVGVPAGSVVQIIGGPIGNAATDSDGYITINGKRTAFQGQVNPVDLQRQYVAICVTGACKPGGAVLIGQATIVGVAKGYVDVDGITVPTTPAHVKE